MKGIRKSYDNKVVDKTPINQQIRAPEVRLIDSSGEMVGVVTTQEALALAQKEKLDLVAVSPNAEPPVCKILDYGKYKYQQQKKKSEAKKHQTASDLKEIQLRPNISEHDYQVKLKALNRFIESKHKVKITVRFRGREVAYQRHGIELLERMHKDIGAEEKVRLEAKPKVEGRSMFMIISPLSSK